MLVHRVSCRWGRGGVWPGIGTVTTTSDGGGGDGGNSNGRRGCANAGMTGYGIQRIPELTGAAGCHWRRAGKEFVQWGLRSNIEGIREAGRRLYEFLN
jgi:hypothetical protein